ncbi:MAG: hypothetical protein WBM07_05015 [Chitinivibrionales bacterium]
MRRNFFCAALLCLAAIFLIPAPGLALDSLSANSAFQFLDEPVIPRLAGMGNAGTAFDNGGFSFVNPAQPYLKQDQDISIGYAPLPGDLTVPFFEAAWGFPDFFLGLHGSNYEISNIIPATEQGTNPANPFSYGFTLLSMDAGYKFGRGAIGLTINGMQERIETSSRFGYSISAGGIYRIIPGKLAAGLALLNEGKTTAFTFSSDVTGNLDEQGEQENLPRSGRLGLAYTDTLKSFPFSVACDAVYRDVGDKVQAASNIVPRITVPLGIEVWPTNYVAVRVGKRLNFETEIINFGAGLRFQPLTFDMAFVVTQLQGDVEVKPMFGLTYAITAVPKPATKLVMPSVKVTDTAATQKNAPVPEAPKTPVDSTRAPAKADSSSIRGAIQNDTLHGAPAK